MIHEFDISSRYLHDYIPPPLLLILFVHFLSGILFMSDCLTLKLWPAHLLVYGQQQGVPGLYPRLEQDLHQLGVLVDDGDGERGPAQRVSAVDV